MAPLSTIVLIAETRADAERHLSTDPMLARARPRVITCNQTIRAFDGLIVWQAFATPAAAAHPRYASVLAVVQRWAAKTRPPRAMAVL